MEGSWGNDPRSLWGLRTGPGQSQQEHGSLRSVVATAGLRQQPQQVGKQLLPQRLQIRGQALTSALGDPENNSQ